MADTTDTRPLSKHRLVLLTDCKWGEHGGVEYPDGNVVDELEVSSMATELLAARERIRELETQIEDERYEWYIRGARE